MRTSLMSFAVVLLTLLTTAFAAGQDASFQGGFPTADAAQKARNEADFQRAVIAYRF